MSGPRLGNDVLGTLDTLARAQKLQKSSTVDEGVLITLRSRGLVEERRGVLKVTARGKTTIQRSNSTSRGPNRGSR